MLTQVARQRALGYLPSYLHLGVAETEALRAVEMSNYTKTARSLTLVILLSG